MWPGVSTLRLYEPTSGYRLRVQDSNRDGKTYDILDRGPLTSGGGYRLRHESRHRRDEFYKWTLWLRTGRPPVFSTTYNLRPEQVKKDVRFDHGLRRIPSSYLENESLVCVSDRPNRRWVPTAHRPVFTKCLLIKDCSLRPLEYLVLWLRRAEERRAPP